MANRTKIKAMAKELGLTTIASWQLKELGIGNLDYLELVLKTEIENRRQHTIAKIRKNCNLPNIVFDNGRLNSGVRYQIEKLLGCDWVEKSENLVIIGECNSGKTALAVYLTSNAIEKWYRAFYIKQDELLAVVKQKAVLPKASVTFNKIKNADLLVLDEMLYLNIAKEDLELLYKTIMSLNETTGIIFVTNREISGWLETAEDKYTMRLLISRAIDNAEIIRLQKTIVRE
jgi:DNA replication protein DnaC